MKKFLRNSQFRWLLLFFVSIVPQIVNSQTVVQIGTGTDVPANTLYFPVYRYTNSSTTNGCRSNVVFTADEMALAGVTTGATITAVQFNKVNQAHFLIPASYKLYMANSNKSSLSTSDTWADVLSTHTEVYSNASFDVQDAPGWFTINVSPFVYTGGSLEIACDMSMTGGSSGATDKFQWEYTSSVPADRIVGVSSSTGTTMSGSVSAYKHRPNIKFTFTDASPCTAPPTAGMAMSTQANVCNGEQFSLSLDGNSTGSGQTYRWQSSTDNVNWTDIPGADFSVTQQTQSVTSYYRNIVTCSSQSDTSTTVMVTSPALVHGTFTINSSLATGGTNFQTFADAMNHVKCGVDGPIVFNVEAFTGPYTEQVIIPEIFGTSATNTITFNGNGNTLLFNSTSSSERYGIWLNGADHVVIDSMIIDGSAGTYDWGVLLTNGADSNTVQRCTIIESPTTTSSNHIGIMINGSPTSTNSSGNNGNYNQFLNNTVTGGYYGIYMYGSSSEQNKGNVSMGNTITDAYTYSNYIYGQESPVISSNHITRPTRTASGTVSACYLSNCYGAMIEKNRIHNLFGSNPSNTSTAYIFYITSSDGTTALPNKVINNLVYDLVDNGTIYGLYNAGSDSTLYYHNTIVFDDATATSGAAYGIYQTTTASGVEYRNNIIYITRGGTGTKRCIYLNTTASEVVSNNNVYWLMAPSGTDNMVGQYGSSDYATLPDWKNANGGIYDQASFYADPLFLNLLPGEYKPSEAAINNIGENLGVLTDIYGVTRTPLPDPGAVEFTLDGCTNPPTAGLAVTSDTKPCAGATFTLNLNGNSVGAGQTYQWQWSTDDTNWSNIETAQTTPLLSTSQTASHYYRAEVKCSGGTAVYSSSVFVENPVVAGNYTINNLFPTSGTNFASFSEAVAILGCGISAPVTFTVEPFTGPYNEQVTIPEIPGTSATNTVTFLCNGATLLYSGTATDDRTALILNGSDHVIIDSLNIDVTGGTNYGWGMQLTNQADSNTIRKCTITTSTSSTSSNFSGIVISGSLTSPTSSGYNGNYNLFENNLITGGYYGIIAYGSTSTQNLGNTFINNKFVDPYYYGMYVYGQKQGTISKSDVSRPGRTTTTTSYGIYITNCLDSMVLEKCRVHNMFDAISASTSTSYAIYITGSDGNASYPSKCENNLVHSINNNSTQYGLYNSSSDNWNIYHNTLILDNTAATTSSLTRALYVNSANVNIKNNIATVSRGGTGTKYCLYLGTSFTGAVNYNDWLMTSASGSNYIAYDGSTSYTTLDDWKLSNSSVYDQNSQSVDPLFQQLTPGDFYPSEPNINNIGEAVGVLTDIVGATRDASPDPGAYEFSVAGCVNPPSPGIVTTVTDVCPNSNFVLDLTGNSAGEGITFQWQVSSDDVNWNNIGTPDVVSSLIVSQASSSYYRALVKCKTGTAVASASVYVTSPGLAPAGTYTINATIPTGAGNFQTFGDAVNFIACGIAGPITFNVAPFTGPYNEQVVIPAVGGTSATNTVTWNGNGNMLTYDVSDGGKRGVLILDGADHMTIDSLNIDASLGTYGYGIMLTNSADSNTIRRCNVMSSTTSTSSNYGGIIMSGSTGSATTQGHSGNGNLITNNTVTGGYYGIQIYGSSSDTIEYNSVVNNMIKDFYYYAMYTVYSRHTTFSNNDISRPTRTNSSSYAVYVSTTYGDILVEKNKLHNIQDGTSGTTLYGFYLSGDGNATWPNRFENNIVYNIKNGNSTCYPVYGLGANYWTLAHNSINVDDASATSGTTYGMYIYGTNTYVYNNIISVTRGGTGTKYCLYMSSTGVTASDNNVLYMGSTGGSTNGIGYDGGARLTLAAWQSLGYDLNGTDENPIFTDVFSGNLKPLLPSIATMGKANVGVLTDILGVVRRVNDPTPGAYEVTTGLPVTLLGIDAVRVGADVKVSWETLTEINNKGFHIERSTDGTHFRNLGFVTTKANNGNSTAKLAYQFLDLAAPTSDVYYRLKQLDNNGKEQTSNVVRLKAQSGRRFDITNLYPNPLHRGNLTLLMTSQETSKITLVITDIAGKVLKQQAEVLNTGNNTLKVNTDNLPAGSYLIRAICADGCETTVKKFVIQ